MSAQLHSTEAATESSLGQFAQHALGGNPQYSFGQSARLANEISVRRGNRLEDYTLLMMQSFEGRAGSVPGMAYRRSM